MSATITFEGLEVPAKVTALDGFRSWYGGLGEASGVRACFCDGKVFVEMSPQENQAHGPATAEINGVLHSLAKELGIGRYYMPPTWITDPATGLSTEPDGFLVPWGSLEKGRVRANPERRIELLGVPEMTLEVVSKTSRKKDLVALKAGYARAGVGEYWVVELLVRAPKLTLLRLGPDGTYSELEADASGWVPSPVFGRVFRFLRFENEAGIDDFRLEVRRRRAIRSH